MIEQSPIATSIKCNSSLPIYGTLEFVITFLA